MTRPPLRRLMQPNVTRLARIRYARSEKAREESVRLFREELEKQLISKAKELN